MSGVGEFLHFVGFLEIWVWEDSGGSWGACDVWEGGCDAEGLGRMAVRGGFVWGNYLVEPKVSSFCIILLNEKSYLYGFGSPPQRIRCHDWPDGLGKGYWAWVSYKSYETTFHRARISANCSPRILFVGSNLRSWRSLLLLRLQLNLKIHLFQSCITLPCR